MAFHIQHAYNNVVTLSQTIDDNNDEESYQLSNKQFVLSELLKLALNLDYGDEIGRRKMFNLMRKYNVYIKQRSSISFFFR